MTLRDEIQKSFYEKYPKEIVNPQDVITWACSEIEQRNAALVEMLEKRLAKYESKKAVTSIEVGRENEAREILAIVKGEK